MIGYTVTTVDSHPIIAVNRTSSTAQKDISKTIRQAFTTLTIHMQELGIMPMGPAVTLFHSIDEKEKVIDFSVGYPIADDEVSKVRGDVSVIQMPDGKVAKAYHKGPYSSIFKTYVEIYKNMTDDGLEHGGAAWEVYLDSPGQTRKEEMLTQIYISITNEHPAQIAV